MSDVSLHTTPLVRKLELRWKLSTEAKAALEATVETVTSHRAGQDIRVQGDETPNLHLIIEGWATRYKVSAAGRVQTITTLIPGDICDMQIFSLNHLDHSIGALTSCKVAIIPLKRLFNAASKFDQIDHALKWLLFKEHSFLQEKIISLAGRPSLQRLSHLICELYFRFKYIRQIDDNVLYIPLTQQYIANSIGISLVHVNRNLKKLRMCGLIKYDNSKLHIIDLDKLMIKADFNPEYLYS